MTLPLAQQWGVTEKAALFVSALADYGDVMVASREAGVSDRYGRELVTYPRVQAALTLELRRKLAIGGALGVRVLLELAEKGTSERVRADCAKALVDRAGFVAPRAAAASQAGDKTLNEMSVDELKDLAAKLEDELAGRAKELSAPPIANAHSQAIDILD